MSKTIPARSPDRFKPIKSKTTVINYTLEQYMEEKKRAENIIKTLEKMASVMEKFEKFCILCDHRINKIERKLKKNGR